MNIDKAQVKLERYQGKKAYRFHVVVTRSDIAGTDIIYETHILSIGSSVKQAWSEVNEMVKQDLIRQGLLDTVEIHSRGPKGGQLYGSMGFESCIAYHLMLNN